MIRRLLEIVCWIRTGHEWVGEFGGKMNCWWCGAVMELKKGSR